MAAAATKKYQWNIGMTCGGCVNQITNLLDKVFSPHFVFAEIAMNIYALYKCTVYDCLCYQYNNKLEDGKKIQFDISLENKTVTVSGGNVDVDTVSGKIKKWANLKEKTYEYAGEVT